MREILFRGKRVDNGKWVYGDLIQSGEKHRPIDREDIPFSNSYIIRKTTPSYTDGCLKGCEWLLSSHAVHVDPFTVGQYTGLKDKNGTMIFEGDEVDIIPENEEIGVIEWADGEAMFVINGDGWCATFDNYYPYDVEVIGNIHDNPELVERKCAEVKDSVCGTTGLKCVRCNPGACDHRKEE